MFPSKGKKPAAKGKEAKSGGLKGVMADHFRNKRFKKTSKKKY